MCGIIAVFKNNPSTCDKEIIEGFNLLDKRGPDSSKCIDNDKEFLGFKRLSINDLSSLGDQPMIYEDRLSNRHTVLICNGEIYNYLELAKEYDLKCISRSDCEVILKLYIKFGIEKTLSLLYGVFAFIIRDTTTDGTVAYIARDRIGIRPLFIGKTIDNNTAFASEAKALNTYCFQVKQIEPSTYITINMSDPNELVTTKYYYLPDRVGTSFSYDELKTRLETAVYKRLECCDRAVGCLLSGGLDSSIIASIICKSEYYKTKKLNTYSVGMDGSEDLKYAKIVAEYLGTNHTEVIFTAKEGINAIPKVIFALESYDITTIRASVGMYLLCKYISENTNDRVIFSGEGSDELLCGYLYFHNAPSSDELFDESLRLVKNLYLYDVLRGDRCVSSNGLELRVPFLDQYFSEYCLRIPGELKAPQNGIEKYILRLAFETELPSEIVWRTKAAFSDAVSGPEKKWYEHIQQFVDTKISDEKFNDFSSRFPNKEAYYYWRIFNDFFYGFKNPVPEYWMPKWSSEANGNPSATVLNIYNDKIKKD
jgi:asparagine synthase (glutamine-hydrolysing)